jgi:hypothetical protein
MNTISWLLDTAAKRWLALLAVAFVVSVGVLMHSFFAVLSPPEQTVVAQRPAAEAAEPVHVRSEPVWNSPPRMGTTEETPAPPVRVSPFAAQDAARVSNDPIAARNRVHLQAEYLRKLIADGKLPRGLGDLTKEQVDEMEKKGILIE